MIWLWKHGLQQVIFYPNDFDFKGYSVAASKLDLTINSKFTSIFYQAYSLLTSEDEIVLGACYKGNVATRIKQEHSYQKMKMTITTSSNDSFTSTQQRFWPQHFTKDKIHCYFSFVPVSKISIKDLDTYNYAMQVTTNN